jgi:hypothetical protein
METVGMADFSKFTTIVANHPQAMQLWRINPLYPGKGRTACRLNRHNCTMI